MSKKFMNGIDANSQRIINVADPSGATDAANKQYVDNVARGLYWKQPVRVASTTNITLTAPGSTIDGVTMATNDRFLAKDQSTGSQNGIYVWNGAAVPATRAADADGGTEFAPGTAVSITEGTANGDKVYMITSDAAITIGTTSQTWGQLGGGTTYTNGNSGISVSGANISAVAGAGITISSGIAIDTSVVARKYAANIGNGSSTSIAVTHSLGTQDIIVSVREVASQTDVIVDWVATDSNTVTVTFATAPASNSHRVMVVG